MYIETKLNPDAEAKVKEIEKAIEDLRLMLWELRRTLLVNEPTETTETIEIKDGNTVLKRYTNHAE